MTRPTPAYASVSRLPSRQRSSADLAGLDGEQTYVQGALALELDRSARDPLSPAHLEPVPGPPLSVEFDPTRNSRLAQIDEAEVRGWTSRFAQAVVETVAGQRPAAQLVRWTTREVHRDLQRRASVLQSVRQQARRDSGVGLPARPLRPHVRSVHLCRISPEVAEASVHVRYGGRSRAVALRLERRDGRWLCTVLEFV